MIREGGELSETKVDVADTGYEIDNNNPVGALEPIRGEMAIEKGMLTPIEKAQIGDNPQACVLCDIIETWLLLNYLQRTVVEETLHNAITVGGNQCSERSQQLLLYVRGERGVGKSRVVKAIHMRFMFLERQSELLLAAPTGAAAANISGATVHGALSIDNRMRSKKQKTVKGPWREQTALIIDKISMVSLKLLATVDTQLSQAKGKPDNDTSVLGGLAIVILMGDFY